jgi:hypothetical protein
MADDQLSSDEFGVGHDRLRAALKKSTSALKSNDIAFALAGGYALWARGAPETEHDVDLVVAEQDVERAAATLAEAGFDVERPPEDWLFKAHLDGAMVDVLHALNSVPVTEAVIAAAEDLDVLGMHIPVMTSTDIVTGKLLAMSERYCDFGAMLPLARAVREQLDWARIRSAVAANPFAVAFLYLTDLLDISREAHRSEEELK